MPYGWTAADAVALARCSKLGGSSEAEVVRRIGLLLRSDDPWLADKATPRLLLSQWNRFAIEVVTTNGADAHMARVQRDLAEWVKSHETNGKGASDAKSE